MLRFLFAFISKFSLLISVGCASSGLRKEIPEYGGLSILQGHTTDSTSQFSVVVPANTVFEYIIQPEAPGNDDRSKMPADFVVTAERKMRMDSSWAVDTVSVRGLKGTSFILFVRNPKTKLVVEKRYFDTLNPAQRFDFVVASCLDDTMTDIQNAIWPQVMSQEPDAIFMIGDNVYADKYVGPNQPASPAEIWKRYVEARKRIDVFFWERLVPIYAIWDDHDYGQNDGNSSFPFKGPSQEIFETFFARTSDERIAKRGPGVAFSLDLLDQRFVFLDGRSFQSPATKTSRKLFGAEQETWAFEAMNRPATLVWLINGMQFFGGYHRFESFEGRFKGDFKSFTDRLRTVKNKFFLISGDRHLFEVMQIPATEAGQDTFEFTTSAMHARTFPGAWNEAKNPRQIAGADNKHNYLLVKTLKKDGRIVSTVEGWSINESLFKREF